jgi:hypothetical protein
MDVEQESRKDRNARNNPINKDKEAPSDDDNEHKSDAPSDDDDSDYKPNNDLQPPPSVDDDSHIVLAAADDGKFYVRGIGMLPRFLHAPAPFASNEIIVRSQLRGLNQS